MRPLLALLFLLTPVQFVAEQRYISLAPHLTEILFDLGVGKQLVATVEHSDYPAEAAEIPVIGNYQQLNLEAILALKPDIIFAWPDGNPALPLQRLESLGMTVVHSDPQNLRELLAEINLIGDMTGTHKRAMELTNKLQKRIEQLTSTYKNRRQVKVFYQVWYQPLRTLGADPWLNDLLSRCGASNLFMDLGQDYPLVSIESVIARQPEMILIASGSAAASETNFWSKWPAIPAVANQSIFRVNPDLLHRYTSRSIEGLESLCLTIQQHRNKN